MIIPFSLRRNLLTGMFSRSKNSTTKSPSRSTLTRDPRSKASAGCLPAAQPSQSVSVRLCSSLRYGTRAMCSTSCRRRRGTDRRRIDRVHWRIWRIARRRQVDRLWMLRVLLKGMHWVESCWLRRVCHWARDYSMTMKTSPSLRYSTTTKHSSVTSALCKSPFSYQHCLTSPTTYASSLHSPTSQTPSAARPSKTSAIPPSPPPRPADPTPPDTASESIL